MSEHPKDTSLTLIERAHDLNDQDAWEVLHERYMAFIKYILRQVGLGPNDVDDVSQQVFLDLTQKLKQYDREKGKFRGWLSTLVRNRGRMHLRSKITNEKYVNKEGDYQKIIAAFESDDMDTLIQNEWNKYLIDIALKVIQTKYKGKAFTVFKLDLAGVSTEQIAEETGLAIASVYTFRKRIKHTLDTELRTLRRDLEW